jgi:hypothetical protein
VVQNLLGEGTLLFQRPSLVQSYECIDTIINRENRVVSLGGRGNDCFHCGHQTGVQGNSPKPTESAAGGLGVFHPLSFTGENPSDSDLCGRANLERGQIRIIDGYSPHTNT